MSKTYTITVHTIAEDGLSLQDIVQAGLTGRIAFIFDGAISSGWPVNAMMEKDAHAVLWEESETGKQFVGVKKWIELLIAGWEL